MSTGTIIRAVPGSGKTTQIINTIRNELELKKIRPEHTFAVAFTKEAAGEMSRRLGNPEVRISTIHSLAYYILYKQEMTEQMPGIVPANDLYNHLLREAIALLEKGCWFDGIDMLLIDEDQDLSLLQARFIRTLQQYADRLVVVGDAMQSIFGFQGGDPELMMSLGMDREMVQEKLDVTHRFGNGIASFINKAFKPDPEIRGRDESGLVALYRQEPRTVIERIDACLHMDEQTGILFRTNQEIAEYARASKNGEKVNCVLPISRHPAVSIASLIISLGGEVDVDMLGNCVRMLGLSSWHFQRSVKLLRRVQSRGVSITRDYLSELFSMAFESNNPELPPIAPKQKLVFNNLMDILDMFSEFYGKPELAGQLIRRLEESGYNLDMGWGLCSIVHEELERAVLNRVQSRQEQYITLNRNSPVTAMTIHSAKGREFDNVIAVVNPKVDIYDPEEFRVYYVALTRARKKVDVVVPIVPVNRERFNVVDALLRQVGII